MKDATIKCITCHNIAIDEKTDWTFIEVTCSDGITGWGESSVNGAGPVLAAMTAQQASKFTGAPAFPNTVQWLSGARNGGLLQHAVLSGIEQALWDAQGQRLGVSAQDLLGGAVRDRIPVYANINRRTRNRVPEGFAESARVALAAGHSHFKLAPFDGLGLGDHNGDEARMAAGIACVRAVCDEVGDPGKVMVDCHWRFEEALAFRLIHTAAELGLFWLECPVPETPSNFPLLGRLKDEASRRGLRLAGVERCLDLADIRAHVDGRHYDVLMPDVKYIGGLSGARSVAELAATSQLHISPHNPTGPVCHAASVAISSVLTNFLVLEIQFDETPIFDALTGQTMVVTNGAIPVPQGPGFGLSLDRNLLAELAVS
ncbi:mandelate racemase/muconate lactonizing enzyme family protein [Oricola indica]|jgi:galactonate dehydratase|uniref:mandelate racemase/muconate lactonizing enzyme family protein n=1 Tax=Oricola indica TaxID=2872591 RepID=UPI001CBDAE79|nr:mandelate racemase/muconate lactonizing enzyme family protein [Oricola indica]